MKASIIKFRMLRKGGLLNRLISNVGSARKNGVWIIASKKAILKIIGL
jgi:hypothetical protein